MADKQAFSTSDGVTDRLYVATNLVIPINPNFVPDMGAVEPPIEPPSLESLFGLSSPSSEEVKGLFARWYDLPTHTWNPGGDVPGDLKGDVLAAYTAIQIYDAAKKVYDDEYYVQKEMQWRVFCADKMIAFVAP